VESILGILLCSIDLSYKGFPIMLYKRKEAFSRLSFLWGEWVGWEAENVIPSP
jgi:hypothetical protein